MSKILVVDDEPFITDMVEATLVAEGYEVSKAYSGEEAISTIEKDPPDLILLDLMLPGMDGYEVSKLLQKDARFTHIPIVMLTARTAIHDRSAGYNVGADDYITKPFKADELLIRVRAQLHHTNRSEYSSLTGLPGSKAVQEAITERTGEDEDWSIIYIDIENFTFFNEVYSFTKGDEVLKKTARILEQAVKDEGNPDDFLGYTGRDDFVIITDSSRAEAIAGKAGKLFKAALPVFFNQNDLKSGHFQVINRNGKNSKVPLLELSFDIVNHDDE
jgi:diguanylate cyclase (GGDEF)-like protein